MINIFYQHYWLITQHPLEYDFFGGITIGLIVSVVHRKSLSEVWFPILKHSTVLAVQFLACQQFLLLVDKLCLQNWRPLLPQMSLEDWNLRSAR